MDRGVPFLPFMTTHPREINSVSTLVSLAIENVEPSTPLPKTTTFTIFLHSFCVTLTNHDSYSTTLVLYEKQNASQQQPRPLVTFARSSHSVPRLYRRSFQRLRRSRQVEWTVHAPEPSNLPDP